MTTHTIWIVEDDAAISRSLQTLLAHSGYAVRAFASGNAVLSSLNEIIPDLMLLDLNLPDVDGLDVCRHIRALPVYLPVIMLTARDAPVERIIGLDAGADIYLTKPFDPLDLLAQIKATIRLIERFGQTQDGSVNARVRELPLTCGPITMWDAEHRVELHGQPLMLAPKEYELLRALLKHPGRVFGRETLLRLVWEYEYEGDTRTVDVHVQRLRQKIEADPAHPQLLVTARGFGYKLISSEL